MRNQPSITTRLPEALASAPEALEIASRRGTRFSARGIAEICGRALGEYAEASALAHVHPFARQRKPGGDR